MSLSSAPHRVHDLAPPVLIPMRCDFFVDTMGGKVLEIASIKAHVSHYQADDSHPWTGRLYAFGRDLGPMAGLVSIPLPGPSRGGRKPALARDMAVLLAAEYFRQQGKKAVRDEVMYLWCSHRKASTDAVAAEARKAGEALCVGAALKPRKAKESHKGITSPEQVSKAISRSKKHLNDTATGFAGCMGHEGQPGLMVLLLRGGGFKPHQQQDGHATLCGPFWSWPFGSDQAEYFSAEDSFEVRLDAGTRMPDAVRQPLPASGPLA